MELEEDSIVLAAVQDPGRVGLEIARRLEQCPADDDSGLHDFATLSNPDLYADELARSNVDFDISEHKISAPRGFYVVDGDDVARVYAKVMNSFGAAGGFKAVLHALQNGESRKEGRLARVLSALEPMSRARAVVDRDGEFGSFGAAARAVIFREILDLSVDELKAEDKVGIPAALRVASVLYPNQSTSAHGQTLSGRGEDDSASENGEEEEDDDCNQFSGPRRDEPPSSSTAPAMTLDKEADVFLLALALKRLKSPVLEVRLKGLARVKERIFRTDAPQTLCNTLRDGGVVESVFSRENLHVEVVKRCEGALRFLAHWRGLSKDQIDLIWNATIGSHENLVHAVYSVVQVLPQHLTPHLREHLWQKIQSIAPDQYDTATVVMLATFSFYAISMGRGDQQQQEDSPLVDEEEAGTTLENLSELYGIPTLFDLISDHAPVTLDVFQEALANLKNLVSWPGLAHCRHLFCSLCIENLARHESALQSLHLMRAVIETFESEKSSHVAVLNQRYDLFRTGVADYVHLYRNYDQDNENSKHSINGVWSVEEHFSQRMAFLSFLLACDDSLVIGSDTLNSLWTCVTSGGVDRDHVLRWFETNVPRFQRDHLTEQLFKLVGSYFNNPEAAKLTSAPGLSLLRRLCKLDDKYEDVAIDAMWGIAVLAEQDDVSRDAGAFLTSMYVWEDEKRKEFVSKCMHVLVSEAEKKIESAHMRITRVVAVLRQFIDEFDGLATGLGISPPPKHGLLSSGETLMVGITVISGPPRFVLEMNSTETVADLRFRIAAQLPDLPSPSTLRLITSGKELKCVGKTLAELNIADKQQFHVTRRILTNENNRNAPPKTAEQVLIVNDLSTQPARILASNPFYEQLLDAVETRSRAEDEVGAKRIWDLLMIMPTNEGIYTKLSMPGGWREVLLATSPYQLFYCLQILESQKDEPFRTLFASEGGVNHLVGVFLEIVSKSQRCPSGCLALLLQTMRRFLEEGINPDDTEEFVQCIFALVAREENEHVTRNALDTLVTLATVLEGALHYIFDDQDRLKSWLVHTLIDDANTESSNLDKRREMVKLALSAIALESAYACSILLDCVASCLPEASTHASPPFYGLLQRLLLNTSITDLQENVDILMRCLHITSEELLAVTKLNDVPTGLLSMAATLIERLENVEQYIATTSPSTDRHLTLSNLTLHLSTLLSSPSGHSKIRYQAYALLIRLCSSLGTRDNIISYQTSSTTTEEPRQQDGVLEQIAERLIELHGKTSPLTMGMNNARFQWSYYPVVLEKTSGFVGLKNLGATCYMNALLQLLFMNSRFRVGLLNEADKSKPESTRHDVFDRLVESFCYLLFSEKRFFDPNDLFACFSVSPTTQMDVDEYLNMLFDKIEGRAKDLLLDCFGGSLINQVQCRDVEFVSEREENFYVLSLDVRRNILDSLEFYVRGEVLDGDNQYYCSPLDRRVDAVKRIVIGKLPRTLILHLKRFEFDFDLMQKTKVNDFCEFPVRLDMSPYMKQQSGNDIYSLEGILVHSGTTESGHYYSFVKERAVEKWFQFNDVSIEPFDPFDIPSACFGGSETIPRFDPVLAKNMPEVVPRTHSAYMLFYQREALAKEDQNRSEDTTWTDRVEILRRKIDKENELFDIDRVAFDLLHCDFVRDFCALEKLDELIATQVLIGYVLDVLCRSRDRSALAEMTSRAEALLEGSKSSAQWLMEKLVEPDLRWAKAFLTSPVASHDARTAFAAIVRAALGSVGTSSDLVSRFAEAVIVGLLKETDPTPEPLAALTHSFCLRGAAERSILLRAGAVMQLIRIVHPEDEDMEAQPKLKKSKTDISATAGVAMEPESPSPTGGYITASLALIVCSQPLDDEADRLLSDEERLLMTSSPFITKALRDDAGSESLMKILSHLCFSNADVSSRVAAVLADSIGIGAADVVLSALLEFDDGQSDLRCDVALGKMIANAEEDETAIGALALLCEESQRARDWLLQRTSESWLEDWLFSPSRGRRESAGEFFSSLGAGVDVLFAMSDRVAEQPELSTSYLRTLRSLAATSAGSNPVKITCIATLILTMLAEKRTETLAVDDDECRLEALHLLLDMILSEHLGERVVDFIGGDQQKQDLLLQLPSRFRVKYMVLHALSERNAAFASALERSTVPDEALRIGIFPLSPSSGQQLQSSSTASQPHQQTTQLRQAAQWLLSSASERSPALRLRHQSVLLGAESLSMPAFVYLRNGLIRDAVDAAFLRDCGGIDTLIEKYLAPCVSAPSERKLLCDANASSLIVVKAAELLRSVGETKILRDDKLSATAVVAAVSCLRLARLVPQHGFREPFQRLVVSLVTAHTEAAREALSLLEEHVDGGIVSQETDGSSSPSTRLEQLDLSSGPTVLPQYLSSDASAIVFAVTTAEKAAGHISTSTAKTSATKICAALLPAAASLPPGEAPRAHAAVVAPLLAFLRVADKWMIDLVGGVLTQWIQVALRRAALLFQSEDAASLLRMALKAERDGRVAPVNLDSRWTELSGEVLRLAESVSNAAVAEEDNQEDEMGVGGTENSKDGGHKARREWLRATVRALVVVVESGVSVDEVDAKTVIGAVENANEKQAATWLTHVLSTNGACT